MAPLKGAKGKQFSILRSPEEHVDSPCYFYLFIREQLRGGVTTCSLRRRPFRKLVCYVDLNYLRIIWHLGSKSEDPLEMLSVSVGIFHLVECLLCVIGR